ncbi:alcohol dehydrogenase catalytic domain-containing protein [Demequina sp. NBRC 110052]|uniref:alcohol dehydrogenase catalytic domain-containing protein n=1 Tax=Demequina sp. NBRC 110052 TaxID=1570341 RepID=UPI000A0054DF|nr:alcohol dehydrogenase catalytic domain-containing protein [Demequina sp. NBRC 110052]
MRAVRIAGPRDLQVIEIDPPSLTEVDNVLVRMVAVGVCGSDVHIYDGTNAAARYPRIMGHELVGVVERVGRRVTRVVPGDRVMISQLVNCGECYACRHDRGNVCQFLQVRGVHIDGGHREFMAVPEHDCHVLPDFVSDSDAVMIEPVTIALQSCARAGLAADDTLLIIGYGALGGTLHKVARLKTAHVMVADISPARLEVAKAMGADVIDLTSQDLFEAVMRHTDGYGATVTIDAAATKNSLMDAMTVTGNAGRVVPMGFDAAPVMASQFLITSKELDVRGSRLQNGRFPEAIRLVQEGLVDIADAVSHTFDLADAQAAFELIERRDPTVAKVALSF